MLERSDERQAYRLPQRVARFGVRRLVGDIVQLGVRVGLEPGDVGGRLSRRHVGRRWEAPLGQDPLSPLALRDRVQTDACCDLIEPSLQRAAPLEAVEGAPRAQISLL